MMLRAQGRLDETAALLQTLLASAAQRGEQGTVAHLHHNLGALQHERGQADEACATSTPRSAGFPATPARPRARCRCCRRWAPSAAREKGRRQSAWFDQAIALASEAAQSGSDRGGLERVIDVLLRNGYPDIAKTFYSAAHRSA